MTDQSKAKDKASPAVAVDKTLAEQGLEKKIDVTLSIFGERNGLFPCAVSGVEVYGANNALVRNTIFQIGRTFSRIDRVVIEITDRVNVGKSFTFAIGPDKSKAKHWLAKWQEMNGNDSVDHPAKSHPMSATKRPKTDELDRGPDMLSLLSFALKEAGYSVRTTTEKSESGISLKGLSDREKELVNAVYTAPAYAELDDEEKLAIARARASKFRKAAKLAGQPEPAMTVSAK